MATETILSPGVFLQEVDKSFIQTATDPSGNVSQCVQIITVERPDFEMMQYPKDWDGFE